VSSATIPRLEVVRGCEGYSWPLPLDNGRLRISRSGGTPHAANRVPTQEEIACVIPDADFVVAALALAAAQVEVAGRCVEDVANAQKATTR